ncbi:MAG: methionine synthase [Firmicutes bacterium]|nr:methionine synthase [Bacillota bacterium]
MDGINKQLKTDAAPKFTHKEYAVQVKPDGVHFAGGIVFTGNSIVNHLSGCVRCAVLAATLGHGVDQALRRLQYADMADALLYDAAANALMEQVCDEAQKQIAESAGMRGFSTTARFSPGYGDFSLAHQPAILKLSGASKELGIVLSENGLMLPQKSVTAVIGLRGNAIIK